MVSKIGFSRKTHVEPYTIRNYMVQIPMSEYHSFTCILSRLQVAQACIKHIRAADHLTLTRIYADFPVHNSVKGQCEYNIDLAFHVVEWSASLQ